MRGAVGSSASCCANCVALGSCLSKTGTVWARPDSGVRTASGYWSADCPRFAVAPSTALRALSSGCTYRRSSSAFSATSCPSSADSFCRCLASVSANRVAVCRIPDSCASRSLRVPRSCAFTSSNWSTSFCFSRNALRRLSTPVVNARFLSAAVSDARSPSSGCSLAVGSRVRGSALTASLRAAAMSRFQRVSISLRLRRSVTIWVWRLRSPP